MPTYLDQLLGAGLLVSSGVDGLYGRSGAFECIVDAVEALITRTGADDGAEVVRFPPAMPRRQLEQSEYLKGFPQLVGSVHCFCGDERAHRDLLKCVDEGEDWGAGQAQTDILLTPAACYPVYPMLAARGPLAAEGALVDVQSWCFRREPSLQPTRMQMFRQREHVRVGSADQVEAFRQTWMARASEIANSLQMPFTLEVANDPFFGRAGRLKADNQRSQNLKFELLIPINDGDGPTACMSFNNHLSHFGSVWDIQTEDGIAAHSGCVGIGLERFTLALLKQHGLQVTEWPAEVRHRLWP
jgi:seryl-tRNA synthetase